MNCTNTRIGRLITRYELDALDEDEKDAFVSHMIECKYCHNEVYSMSPFMSVLRARRKSVTTTGVAGDPGMPEASVRPRPPTPVWLRSPVLLAASMLIVAGGVIAFSLLQHQNGSEAVKAPGRAVSGEQVAKSPPLAWQEVEVPPVTYAAPSRPSQLRGVDSASAFERAMIPYQQGDYAAAAERLEVMCRLNPEHAEANLFWGVSLLLEGRSGEAMSALTKAVELSAGPQRETSRYYLALAHLKSNQPHRALAELEAVVTMNGNYRAQADRLRERVRAALK